MVETTSRWPTGSARDGDTAQPWRVGYNFIPNTAVNQLEKMWGADTFEPETIDREQV